MADAMNTQAAPYPAELETVLDGLDYRHGAGRVWQFTLAHDYDRGPQADPVSRRCRGLTLVINVTGADTYNLGRQISVDHLFAVPAATYNTRSWMRWVFDRIGDVETHERMENFLVGGRRPYAPLHSPGNDPYLLTEARTDAEAETSYLGVRDPGSQQQPRT